MTSQAWWDTGIVGISLIMLIFGVLDITNMWVYTQLHNKLQYPHCMHILEIQYFNTKAWICNWINVSFVHIDGLVQDCGISWALALKILQSRIKPSMLCWLYSICLDAIEFHYNAVQYIMILHQVEHFPGNKLNAQKSVYILPSQEWRGLSGWLSARLWYLNCISNGDTTVLHQAIDLWAFWRKINAL